MRIDSSGNVKLNGDSPYIYLSDNDNNWIRGSSSVNAILFGSNNTERMRIDSSGRLLLNSGTDVRIELGTTGTTGTNDRNHLRGDGANLKYNTASGGVHVFEQNGSEAMRIDSSGRLLLGPTSASLTNKFLLQGDTGSANNGGYMRLQTANSIVAGTGLGAIGFGDSSFNGALIEATGDVSWSPFTKGSRLQFSTTADGATNPTVRLHIDSAGNVGVGVTSPASKLHVAGDAFFTDWIYSGNSKGISSDAAIRPLLFGIGGSEKARIDSSGRLLLNGGTDVRIELGTTGTTGTNDRNHLRGDGANLKYNTASGGVHVFEQNGTERMRIDSSGNVGVGTTSPSAKLDVVGTSGSTTVAEFSYTAANAVYLKLANASNALGFIGYETSDLAFYTNNTRRMRLDSNGIAFIDAIYTDTTSNAANVHVGSNGRLSRSTSSLKYKAGVETLEDSYADAILNCRPVWYRSTSKIDNPEHGWWGFIAEEVAEVDPRLVHWKTTEAVVQENGSIEHVSCDPEPEGVQYDRFVPHLLNLIKRQKEQIEAMEARLSALEAS